MKLININGYEIPASIDLLKIFTEKGLKKEIKHIAKYQYILHVIYKKQIVTNTWVPLKSTILSKIITKRKTLARIKNTLKILGIIKIDDHYIPGSKSKGYFITEAYLPKCHHIYNYNLFNSNTYHYSYIISSQPFIPLCGDFFTSDNIRVKYNIISNSNKLLLYYIKPINNPFIPLCGDLFISSTDVNKTNITYTVDEKFMMKQEERMVKLKERVKKTFNNKLDDLLTNPSMPQYRYIQRNIIDTTVDKAVYNKIDQMLATESKLRPRRAEFIKDGIKLSYWKNTRKMTKKIAEIWKDLVRNVELGIGNVSVPCSTLRFYSSITSYPSELRSYIRCRDKKLYYIDIRNSQPFLFLYFVLTDLEGVLPDDVKKYIDLVSSGQFYEYLMLACGRMEIMGKDTSEMTPEELWEYEAKRSQFKIDFFGKVFFSKGIRNWKERDVFERLFPTVSSIINKMKKDNYRDLSIKLQKFEASIVLDKMFYRLATLFPESYAVPIHDAIICEDSIRNEVEKIMIEEIFNIIGVKPSLKVERLN